MNSVTSSDEPQPARQVINVYLDESGLPPNRYLVLGGIWIPETREQSLRDAIINWRNQSEEYGELKSTKISKAKLSQYKHFADFFFDYQPLHFHCIVVDSHLRDDKTFSDGNPEIGFYKFFFHLLSHRIVPGNTYNITFDQRNTTRSSPLDDMLRFLNKRCVRDKLTTYPPITSICEKNSEDDHLIQLADLLLGSVHRRWNGTHTSSAKSHFLEYIETRVGRRLDVGTRPHERPFSVWNWKPSP